MSDVTIRLEMTMAEVLERIPSAQRALFQRYHVGGCSSCAFQPTDTLAKVCADHNILDPQEVVDYLLKAHDLDQKIQVEPREVRGWLDAGEELAFIDVRSEDERALARIPEAEALDFGDSDRYLCLPRDRKLVFSCKDGQRSMDVAAYFIGHGFTNVWAVKGGLDAWREQVDPSIPDSRLRT